MALRTHNLPSGHLKCDFEDVFDAMFQGVEKPQELIFYLLGNQKSDLDGIAEVLFQVRELPGNS
jgi:hypothetical protein